MAIMAQNINQKPGYKLTEVGVIPEDWEVSTVGTEFEVQLGKMLDAEKNKGLPKPYIGNRAVQWGHIDISDLQIMAMSRSDLERFRLRLGDLLVCEGGEVGRAALWEAPIEECYYQKALHRLRSLRGFNPYLMLAFLQYWTDHKKLTNYVSQTSIAHLTREKFIEVPMLVPHPDEQKAIATVLTDIDALITLLDKLIAKKRDIKQATMQQLLMGKTRLPGFRGKWMVKELGEIFEITAGQSKSKFIKDGGKYFITDMGSVSTSGNLITTKQTNFEGDFLDYGDLIMPKDDIGGGNIIGRVAFIDQKEKYVLGDHVYKLKLISSEGDSLFLSYLINSHTINMNLRRKVTGSAQLGLNRKSVKEEIIAFPSLLEQQAIATVLSDMDAEIAALEQRREKTRMLKQGMMQELLTGKTRLV